MARRGCIALAVLTAGCSSTPAAGLPPAGDAGKGADASLDAHADAKSDAGGDSSADASGSSDAAPLPACDHGKTCALPLLCDPSDLLCETPCDATRSCGAGTFCRPAGQGSPTGTCIGADYQCLGDVPAPPAPTSPVLTLALTFVDASGGKPVPAPGLTVKICAHGDAACTGLAMGTTGADGTLTLSVALGTGFDGYLDVTGPSGDGSTIAETLVFWSAPIVTASDALTTTVESADALQSGLASLGTLDPTRATVLVVDDACRSTPAFGASLSASSADAATRVGYVGPTGLVAGATSFPANDQARAYVANVPGTTTTLTTTYSGEAVNALDVFLRPGALVVAYLAPTP